MKNKQTTTYGGVVQPFHVPDNLLEGVDGEMFRQILDWYLRIHEELSPRIPRALELEAGREGVDYVIKEAM